MTQQKQSPASWGTPVEQADARGDSVSASAEIASAAPPSKASRLTASTEGAQSHAD